MGRLTTFQAIDKSRNSAIKQPASEVAGKDPRVFRPSLPAGDAPRWAADAHSCNRPAFRVGHGYPAATDATAPAWGNKSGASCFGVGAGICLRAEFSRSIHSGVTAAAQVQAS